mgnify:CR=1 FL=1
MAAKKGSLSISSENIFPIIKKWVYSDHDIFARELVSNGCDAITKLKKLDMMGEYQLPDDYKPAIKVEVNPEEKTLKFTDNGLGMTADEVEEYITQIAFSGATQFLEKYKDKTTEDDMIGHFGLGFYSAFMVADEVHIDTLSYKEGAKPVHWVSNGGTEYEMEEGSKQEVGSTMTLYLNEDSLEFANEYRMREVLEKYPMTEGIMRGEGEETFAELVAYYEGRGAAQLINIQGITFREEEKQIAATPFRQIMDLSKVPFVYGDIENFKNRIIYYETSRGCPFSCSYCLSSIDKCLRFRNLELVKKELQFFIDHEVPQVKFVDRTFNCNRQRAIDIWSYLVEHDNGITNFHFEISSDLLGEEELELFAKMRPGLIQLEIGVQSTNGETVDAIHRHMDLEKLFHYVDRVHALGNIHQHLDLIAGLPYENYERFGVSFDDLYAHKPDQLQLGFLKVLKGTMMEEEVKKYSILYRNQPPYEVLGTKWLSYDEIILLKGVEELVELYYNSGQYTLTLKYAVPFFESPFRFYEMFSAWYRGKGYHKLNHNRLEKYNILREFLREHIDENEWDTLDEIMLYDMYLRENVKGRPAWAKDTAQYKKEWKALYREQGEKLFPEDVQAGIYDSKRAANQSHIEVFEINIKKFEQSGQVEKKQVFCLFDYSRRNPLNRAARTVEWEIL